MTTLFDIGFFITYSLEQDNVHLGIDYIDENTDYLYLVDAVVDAKKDDVSWFRSDHCAFRTHADALAAGVLFPAVMPINEHNNPSFDKPPLTDPQNRPYCFMGTVKTPYHNPSLEGYLEPIVLTAVKRKRLLLQLKEEVFDRTHQRVSARELSVIESALSSYTR